MCALLCTLVIGRKQEMYRLGDSSRLPGTIPLNPRELIRNELLDKLRELALRWAQKSVTVSGEVYNN